MSRAREDAGIVALVRVLQQADIAAREQGDSMQCLLVLGDDEQPIRIGDRGDSSGGVDPSGGDDTGDTFKPRFRVEVRDMRALQAHVNGLTLGRAYVQGALDIVPYGDDARTRAEHLMAAFWIRDVIRSGTPVSQALLLAAELAVSSPTRVNARAIARDYNLEDAFYHTFLDEKYRLYSQCRFTGVEETVQEFEDPRQALCDAATRKLDHVKEHLALKHEDRIPRILDIGAGWGGVTAYFDGADNPVNVTSLTLSETHEQYVRRANVGRTGDHEVLREDLLEHRRRQFYDGIVILGVIEHIPNYRLFCERVWDALKPGGRLYLDASATKEKYAISAFTRRYTWHGPHSCLALPDLVEELLFHGFRIVHIDQDSLDYERTMRAWALRLDMNRDAVVSRWGEYVYRAYRVFLWGGAHAFASDRLQAYTLVAERADGPGPRPGRLRRTGEFLASLR